MGGENSKPDQRSKSVFGNVEEFEKLFEKKKPEIEKHIKELLGIADKLDKVNKDRVITEIVRGCVSVAGRILTIVGLVLGPVTLGASTVVSAVGVCVGVAAGATSIATAIIKYVKDGNDNDVNQILKQIKLPMNALTASGRNACIAPSKWDENSRERAEPIFKLIDQCYAAHCDVDEITRLVQLLNLLPELNAVIQEVIREFKSSAKGNEQRVFFFKLLCSLGDYLSARQSQLTKAQEALKAAVEEASRMCSSSAKGVVADVFSEAAPVVASKAARIAVAGVFVLWDVYDITKNAIDFHEGCKSERAKEIREIASNVQTHLELLNTVYSGGRADLGWLSYFSAWFCSRCIDK